MALSQPLIEIVKADPSFVPPCASRLSIQSVASSPLLNAIAARYDLDLSGFSWTERQPARESAKSGIPEYEWSSKSERATPSVADGERARSPEWTRLSLTFAQFPDAEDPRVRIDFSAQRYRFAFFTPEPGALVSWGPEANRSIQARLSSVPEELREALTERYQSALREVPDPRAPDPSTFGSLLRISLSAPARRHTVNLTFSINLRTPNKTILRFFEILRRDLNLNEGG
ncbi:MAG: hypothetical protein AB7G93_01740 [Bdellovibrionales bacterium]